MYPYDQEEVNALKPVFSVCLACLLTLSACGAQTQPVPPLQTLPEVVETPVPLLSVSLSALETQSAPCDLPLSRLPLQPAKDSSEVWSGEEIYLFAQLPQEEVSLYGLGSGEELILRKGDTLTAFALPWHNSPRSYLPQLHAGDPDGDGQTELILLTYTSGGTGVDAWSLTVFESGSEGWRALTLPEASYEALSSLLTCTPTAQGDAILSLGSDRLEIHPDSGVTSEAPLEPYTGTIVNYRVEEDTIAVKLAVGLYQEDTLPYTLYYPATLEAELCYSGAGLSLASPRLLPAEG